MGFGARRMVGIGGVRAKDMFAAENRGVVMPPGYAVRRRRDRPEPLRITAPADPDPEPERLGS